MKQMIDWQTSVAVTALIALGWTAFPVSSTVASTTMLKGLQPSAPEQTSFQNEAKYELAQASNNCRRVDTRASNLNVRSSPSGPIIGSLTDRTLVSIENTGSNGAHIGTCARQWNHDKDHETPKTIFFYLGTGAPFGHA